MFVVLGSSVPIEIGEMDGRNAGSAVIGFVNGMSISKISFPFDKFSFALTSTMRKKQNTHTQTGMTTRREQKRV